MSSEAPGRLLKGTATARGLVVGPAFLYRGEGDLVIPEFRVKPGEEEKEIARFRLACERTRRDIEGLVAILRSRTGDRHVQVFESHMMFLSDPMLIDGVTQLIREEHLNALAATRQTADATRAAFGRMNDPYFRERVRDFNDVERRLLRALIGHDEDMPLELSVPSIIVADDLTPSETIRLPRELVLGFALNGGSPTSHATLLARAMGIPAVTGLGSVTESVQPGETLILDGTVGTVVVSPDEESVREALIRIARAREESDPAVSGVLAGMMADGGTIRLEANVQSGVAFDEVLRSGACGIGLYRSEYLWLGGEHEPTEEEQFVAYRAAAECVAKIGSGAALTVRTLDLGGDKLLRGVSAPESNPFLGNRSIRYLLSHRDVFRTQLRAILRASAFGPVRIMHPMVSCIEELKAAQETLMEVRHELDAEGVAYDKKVPVGIMIEVPAAALNAEALARHVDFFSIGTNDLVQYTLAADRGNELVANLYQPTHPAVLKLIRTTIAAAKAQGIEVGVCGESASDPVLGVLWAAFGVGALSMSAAYVSGIAKVLARLTRADLDAYAAMVASLADDLSGVEILARCREWMSAFVGEEG